MTWAPNFQFWEPKGLPKIFLRQQPWYYVTIFQAQDDRAHRDHMFF